MPWFAIAWPLLPAVGCVRGVLGARQSVVPRTAAKAGTPVITWGGSTSRWAAPANSLRARLRTSEGRGKLRAILTRGYVTAVSLPKVARGASGPTLATEQMATKPQIFVARAWRRLGIGPIAIEPAAFSIASFGVDTVVLTIGFQHVRLARSVDIVLIDALKYIRGRSVFRWGGFANRRAESRAADVIVITRSSFSPSGAGGPSSIGPEIGIRARPHLQGSFGNRRPGWKSGRARNVFSGGPAVLQAR